jgi:hypothetical protein
MGAPQARTSRVQNGVRSAGAVVARTFQTFHSRYQAGTMDTIPKAISKDEVIAASKRHPRPDHGFQYGTAGVSSLSLQPPCVDREGYC